MKSTKPVALALMMALSLFACRSGGDDDDGGNGGDDNQGDDGSTADDTSIFDIQSDDMAVGMAVTVRGAVVVAVDAFGQDQGRLFIMEPEGGPYSGVLVFLRNGEADGLAPGDLVDVEGGVKDEFALDSDESGRTTTEISAPDGGAITVTKVGDGDVPEPETVVPWELAGNDAEAEKWEGVLVRFENVRVNKPPAMIGDDPTRVGTNVTGPFDVQSDLTDFTGVESGNCYASMTGIGDYFFTYKILPRSADDIVAGEDGDCLAPEGGDELCGDQLDNDFDGFADCEDFSCAGAAVACPVTEATIAAIQGGEIPADSDVSLQDVVVTAVQRSDTGSQNFWVQDAAQAAENNGVVVFWPTAAGELPAGVVVGATVDISATVSEFPCLNDTCTANPLTELTFATLGDEIGAGEDPVPVAVADPATLATDPDEEPFEGVLVRIENVTVVSDSEVGGQFTVGDAGAPLFVDNDMFSFTPTAGQCLSSITGVMHRNIQDGHPSILPRDAADIDDTDCP